VGGCCQWNATQAQGGQPYSPGTNPSIAGCECECKDNDLTSLSPPFLDAGEASAFGSESLQSHCCCVLHLWESPAIPATNRQLAATQPKGREAATGLGFSVEGVQGRRSCPGNSAFPAVRLSLDALATLRGTALSSVAFTAELSAAPRFCVYAFLSVPDLFPPCSVAAVAAEAPNRGHAQVDPGTVGSPAQAKKGSAP